MGQKYAAYDPATNLVTGYYDSIDSPPNGGLSVIPITDAVWQGAINQGGTWKVSGSDLLFQAPPTPTLAQTTALLATQIDNAVADVYAQFTRFQQEYLNREAAAQAFKTAGYVGDPGTYVTSYATAAGVSNQVATDTILTQADTLNTALASLAAVRMQKYTVLNAADATTAQTAATSILAQIQAIASQLS